MKKSKSFVKSLTRSYLLVSLVPFVIVLTFVFGNTIHHLKENIQKENENAAELIASQTDSLLGNMTFLSIQLTNNVMTNAKGLAYAENTLVKEEQYYSQIQAECCSYAVVDSLYDVTFFSKKGYYITSDDYNMNYGSTYRLPAEELAKLSWLDEADRSQGRSILLPVSEGNVPLREKKYLTLARAIRDPGKVVGYLCVQADLSDLDEILKIGESEHAQIMVWDADRKRSIYSTDNFPGEDFRGNDLEEMIEKMESRYYSVQKEIADGIEIILLSDKRDIYVSSLKAIGFLVGEAIVLLALTILFIKYYAGKMTKPLVALTEQMNKMTLDMLKEEKGPEKFPYEEIQYLYMGYEEMQKRLDIMIKKEIAGRTMWMQERLNSLQAQINPHFLYNTLNVIGIMGCESRNQKIYEACLKLTSILRYSIADKNSDVSTVYSEVENLRAYFELMKLRFEHRIEYDIQCEKNVEEIEIPRLCLQPFVENMFEHAYDAQHRKVYACISCKRKDGYLEILIQDDGQGMEKERIEEMKAIILKRQNELECGRTNEAMHGIGVENTMVRMSLFFEGKFKFDLDNAENGGMRVRMWIKVE